MKLVEAIKSWRMMARIFIGAAAALLISPGASWLPAGQSEKTKAPVAWWTFERGQGTAVKDAITGTEDTLSGNFKFVLGVSGTALRFDGYTTEVVRKSALAPRLTNALALEAWVALGAYPWNTCAVAGQSRDGQAGYSFWVGPQGEFGLSLNVAGHWYVCTSTTRIPLRQWTHIAATYDESTIVTLYMNGEKAGELAVSLRGRMTFARDADLRIGINQQPTPASHPHRLKPNLPTWYSFDGIIDELKIYDRGLDPAEVKASYLAIKPELEPDLPRRVLPSGPDVPARFGAYYTTLKYYEEWDALWPVGPDADIVVRFDDSPVKVVFWRGTRYSPAWVTGEGFWVADQSVETWNDEEGCFEHMQDRHCTYSHVRIIENTDARVVVHWRYAPVSTRNNLWKVDEKTGWGNWVDEYYYFYPDGTGIRRAIWRSTLGDSYQVQETSVLCHPGQKPEDMIDLAAITLVNLRGELYTYSFPGTPESRKNLKPAEPNIQVLNLRSATKPFIIFEPGTRMVPLGGTKRQGVYSAFPMCNHWPVGQVPSDGRTSQAPDRAVSFSPAIASPPRHKDGNIFWGSWLYGTTREPAGDLVFLANSWIHPAEMKVVSPGLANKGYDKAQRAYVLECLAASPPPVVTLEWTAKPESPLDGVCLLIRGWGEGLVSLSRDGAKITPRKDYRTGTIRHLDRTDLVIWIPIKSVAPVRLTLENSL